MHMRNKGKCYHELMLRYKRQKITSTYKHTERDLTRTPGACLSISLSLSLSLSASWSFYSPVSNVYGRRSTRGRMNTSKPEGGERESDRQRERVSEGEKGEKKRKAKTKQRGGGRIPADWRPFIRSTRHRSATSSQIMTGAHLPSVPMVTWRQAGREAPNYRAFHLATTHTRTHYATRSLPYASPDVRCGGEHEHLPSPAATSSGGWWRDGGAAQGATPCSQCVPSATAVTGSPSWWMKSHDSTPSTYVDRPRWHSRQNCWKHGTLIKRGPSY